MLFEGQIRFNKYRTASLRGLRCQRYTSALTQALWDTTTDPDVTNRGYA